jgi:hypothetical protein
VRRSSSWPHSRNNLFPTSLLYIDTSLVTPTAPTPHRGLPKGRMRYTSSPICAALISMLWPFHLYFPLEQRYTSMEDRIAKRDHSNTPCAQNPSASSMNRIQNYWLSFPPELASAKVAKQQAILLRGWYRAHSQVRRSPSCQVWSLTASARSPHPSFQSNHIDLSPR